MSAEQTPDIAAVLAEVIEARADEVYPTDVFIPPTDEDFAEINALLQRERGHMLDGVGAECYRRAYRSIAAQLRDGTIDVAPVLDAAVREAEQRAEALRETIEEVRAMSLNYHRQWHTGMKAETFDQGVGAHANDVLDILDRADRITEPVSHEAATSGEEASKA